MRMEGIIVQGVGGRYQIVTDSNETVEAIARGKIKKEGIKPVIGDRVCLEKEADSFAVSKILERKNYIIRPAVANIDQMIVVIAAAEPDPNFKQTDKLLTMLEYKGYDVILCINKTDLDNGKSFGAIYEKAGYKVLYVSGTEETGVDSLKACMQNKITAFAGCSGVGKSSLINAVEPGLLLETGAVGKIKRGRHTTTHARLLPLSFGGYIADTPGFSVVDITEIPKEELDSCFIEMADKTADCRFMGCAHKNEPDCAVIQAVEKGEISKERYGSYLAFYDELSAINKY